MSDPPDLSIESIHQSMRRRRPHEPPGPQPEVALGQTVTVSGIVYRVRRLPRRSEYNPTEGRKGITAVTIYDGTGQLDADIPGGWPWRIFRPGRHWITVTGRVDVYRARMRIAEPKFRMERVSAKTIRSLDVSCKRCGNYGQSDCNFCHGTLANRVPHPGFRFLFRPDPPPP